MTPGRDPPAEPGAPASPDAVEGTVERVVYAATDGVFAVVRLQVSGREQPVTVVGPLGGLVEGEVVRAVGRWETHGSYGRQLRAARALPVVPRSSEGIERYLGTLKGIGAGSAKRLVAAFGERAIEVLADEPWRAAKVRGIGKKRAQSASEEARVRRAEREVMVFLQGQGISAAYAARIRKRWGDQAIAKVRENPYRLAREVSGIGFRLADKIARGMGIAATSPLRAEAALYHTLEVAADEGHCYLPAPVLQARAAGIVDAADAAGAGEVGQERLAEGLRSLVAQGAVVLEDDERVFLPYLHHAEVQLARRLGALLAAPRPMAAIAARGRAASELARLSPAQRRAVEMARSARVAVITGGPGTGKTTVMKATVAAWEEARRRVILAAPTGRAAKRLSETTGRAASTVHRLLEWSGDRTFGRDERHPLEADLVIVDEASMLDLPLSRALAAAVPIGATLLLVGDVDQLPSVGPGQVLGDVIQSGIVPVARLTEIFRQASGSRIVETAHAVLAGEVPQPSRTEATGREAAAGRSAPAKPADDFYVIPVEDPLVARDRVLRVVCERIPRAFGFHPLRDVQVLTPMHRGEAGTEALNRALQQALNPSGAELARGNRPALRVGDKVLQTRNDYEREVWNGDIGEVVAVDAEEPSLQVAYDERRVGYDRQALEELELAYAVSVHKSQGSEYPAVVIALLPEHHLLLRRNLLYTAITRGKRLVVVVGSPKALRRAVSNTDTERRWTRLRERLREHAAEGQRQNGR